MVLLWDNNFVDCHKKSRFINFFEIAAILTNNKIGQSICVGIRGDPITGFSFNDCLLLSKEDPKIKALMLIGESGENIEEIIADFISHDDFPKPIVAMWLVMQFLQKKEWVMQGL